MRDEFTAQKAQLSKFNTCGGNLCNAIEPSSPELRKVEDKLNSVNSKWNDLLGRLDERKNSLDAAAGTSKDFNTIMNKLMDVLMGVSDAFDDLPPRPQNVDEQLKKLEVNMEFFFLNVHFTSEKVDNSF